ncbi:uncharacterized protein LOC126572776 [Anopheles aquasalis]|uniref:uncharacterized protein LOC126572776 n=1 Tax=Anopheles aquasalis TaxID=42839 RepID=UPI00215A7CD9|nr:uncharacterized protein LOC126572776 [Anopheles aquasalis]
MNLASNFLPQKRAAVARSRTPLSWVVLRALAVRYQPLSPGRRFPLLPTSNARTISRDFDTNCNNYEDSYLLCYKSWLRTKSLHALRIKLIRERVWKLCKVVLLCALIALSCYYIPVVNWHVTAIGRLIMIELLPFWDWTPLYRSKCLIERSGKEGVMEKPGPFRLMPEDCAVCENLGSMPVHANLTYERLYSHGLMSNTPIIVADGVAEPWHEHIRYGGVWSRFMTDVEDLLLNNPCDFQTNLLFRAPIAKPSAVARMVELLEPDVVSNGNEKENGWFVQFRNCAKPTVKRTRLMFRKPYFYPAHWESPFTSWLLLSSQYRAPLNIAPNMAGLVIVSQLRSQLNVTLSPRHECAHRCQTQRILLQEQQTLLFSTTLWNFVYSPSQLNRTSVTFITETYENA